MPLGDFELRASIAVSDIQRAIAFYEGKLGLSATSTRSLMSSPRPGWSSSATTSSTMTGRGITARAGGGRIAWFQDPDGNTFAIEADA